MISFLVDEDVNQRPLRMIPAREKGFDLLYPEEGDYKGAHDPEIRSLAKAQGRVIVTCDKDFARSGLHPSVFPQGVLWIRPLRMGQKRVGEILARFCSFQLEQFPENPYSFEGKIFEISDQQLVIHTVDGSEEHTLPLELPN